jgi:hypothetical protein
MAAGPRPKERAKMVLGAGFGIAAQVSAAGRVGQGAAETDGHPRWPNSDTNACLIAMREKPAESQYVRPGR